MLGAVLWMLLACADDAGVHAGAAVFVGEGQAWAMAETDADGATTRLGVALTPGALQGLPTVDSEWVLALPTGLDLAPFDHVGLGWLPAGHDPLGIWDEPHFDVHVFLISQAARAAIDFDDARIGDEPPSETVPPGYVMAPTGAVSGQGAHWIDGTSPEWSGGPFTGSLVFGSWDAQWTFIEPMVTWASLVAGSPLSGDVPWPDRWQSPGRYPTTWSVGQTDTAHEVVLGDLQDG